MIKDGICAQADDRNPTLGLLISPAFLICLVGMLANDLILKQAFPGFITGKVSDVTGLFICYLFFLSFTANFQVLVGVVIALLFALWKVDLSTPYVDMFNRLSPIAVHRVMDPTDIFAICVLPLSWWYARTYQPRYRCSWLEPLLLASCPFIFAGSAARHTMNQTGWNDYIIHAPFATCIDRIQRIAGVTLDGASGAFTLIITVDNLRFCYKGIIRSSANYTGIHIETMALGAAEHKYQGRPAPGATVEYDSDRLFEKAMLRPLKTRFDIIGFPTKADVPWEN